jgi:catechol 2,3-dioxygenase-like lactoylglutathione lyase family enzyme
MHRLDHTGIGVADIARSARFYDAVLGALGLRVLVRIDREKQMLPDDVRIEDHGGIGYGTGHPVFWIDVFHPHGTRVHTCFRAYTHAEVDAFYAAGVAAGGLDNGPPGLRSGGYPAGYYAAFLLDPDGNNIEVVCRDT